MRRGRSSLWLHAGRPFAHAFGIREKRARLGQWFIALGALGALLLFWNIASSGCFNGGACQLTSLPGSSFLEIALALVALGWSIGIAISQQEQSELMRGFAAAEQRFSATLQGQLAKLDEHFSDIPSNGQDLVLQVYVSSPAFGILSGPDALRHYVNILRRFTKAALLRASNGESSRLYLYLWSPSTHLSRFNWELENRKEFWDAPQEEWESIVASIQDMCTLLQQIHQSNITCTSDSGFAHPADLHKIEVFIFYVPEDECRFFLLDTRNTKRAAMIAMAPIAGEKQTDLNSVLLMDNTPRGVEEMRRFATAFTHKATQGSSAVPRAREVGAEACESPKLFFKSYFGYDFSDPAAPWRTQGRIEDGDS